MLTISYKTKIWWVPKSGMAGTLNIKNHNQANNDTLESHMTLQVLLPLNRVNHLEWFFSTQLFWAWNAFTCNLSSLLIYVNILVYSVVQLEMLQIKFRNFVEPNFSLDAVTIEVHSKGAILKQLIREHQHIIRLVNHPVIWKIYTVS